MKFHEVSWFRRQYVVVANTIIFVGLAIWYGVPFHSWSKLWADFKREIYKLLN